MKKLLAFYLLIIPVILLVSITGCKKDTNSNLPLLSTAAIIAIDSTAAISGGNVFSDGGYPVTARGICWSASSLPSITNNKTTDGQGTGSFSSSMTGLAKGIRYYVRAYATNSFGTAYGQAVLFYTLGAPPIPIIMPALQTLEASNITSTSATLNGTVGDTLNANITFEYGETDAYGLTAPAILNGSVPVTMGNYSKSSTILVMAAISGLLPYTTYHYRIRVDDQNGTTYGDDFVFMTTY